MAGPEPIQEWHNQHGGRRAASSSYRPGWDGVDSTPITDRRALIPVAWFGRTATSDQQDSGGSLALLRQLCVSQRALPVGCVIVAYFYDVGSGRMDLDVRGRGDRHERLAIPLPRDGGIHDLLAEAANPNRRFHAVICEQIGRLPRRIDYRTFIEHQLQSSGVQLWTADEEIEFDADYARTGALPQHPALAATHRVAQQIEWFRDMPPGFALQDLSEGKRRDHRGG